MGNTYTKMTDSELLTLVTNMASVCGTTPAAYGLSSAQVTALSVAADGLQISINDTEAKKTAYRSSVDEKSAQRSGAIEAVSGAAGTMYAYSGITPALISAAGLQPHSTSRTRVIPADPLALVATPSLNGTVALNWNRNGNPSSVTFLVEASADCVTWEQVDVTTKSKTVLNGYAPGVTAWFRIKATRNGITTNPCAPIPIYATGSGSGVELKVA